MSSLTATSISTASCAASRPRGRTARSVPRTDLARSLSAIGGRDPDPFDEVWPGLVAWLEVEPDRMAKELLQRLRTEGLGEFPDGQLRTLQRRVKEWRHHAARHLVFAMPTPLLQSDPLLCDPS